MKGTNLGQPYAARVIRYNSDVASTLEARFRWKKANAKKAGIAFNLTLEDVLNKWNAQDGKCAYSGQPMAFTLGRGRYSFKNNVSLDRLDPSQGYTPDNVVLCRVRMNSKKASKTLVQFALTNNSNFKRAARCLQAMKEAA